MATLNVGTHTNGLSELTSEFPLLKRILKTVCLDFGVNSCASMDYESCGSGADQRTWESALM